MEGAARSTDGGGQSRRFQPWLVASLLTAGMANAQRPVWIEQFGTTAIDELLGLALDGRGGVYAVGFTGGALGGTYIGDDDAWIARFDESGARLWARQLGNLYSSPALGVASDGAGGAFLCGWKQGSLGGPATNGLSDAWLARYDDDGDRAWIRQLSTGSETYAFSCASDGVGGVLVTGLTTGDLASASAGFYDAWLASYDHGGRLLWIRQFGTALPDFSFAVSRSPAGDIYVAGHTIGGVDPSPKSDAWIACFDAAGEPRWTRRLATPEHDVAYAVASAESLGVYVCGFSLGAMAGPSAGGADAWLALYDRMGNQRWLRQIGAAGHEFAHGVSCDAAGNAYVCGSTTGSLAGPIQGQQDLWVAKFDPAGNQLALQQLGTQGGDQALAVVAGDAAGILVGGHTTGSLAGTGAGFADAWLARFDF